MAPNYSFKGALLRTIFKRAFGRRVTLTQALDVMDARNQPIGAASSPNGPWVWLFPLAYGFHIAEEYWLHFPDWVSHLSRSFVSNPQFLLLNGSFWLLMVFSVVAIRARTSLAWLIATLAAILGINAALHLLGSLVTRTYSPGSITAAFLYLPLVLYAFRQVLPWITRGLALRAVGLGAAIHAGVVLLAAHPSLLPAM
jgi:hypothetical protein